ALLPEIKSSAIMVLNSLSKCLFIIQIYSFGLYKFVTSNVDTPLYLVNHKERLQNV
ncbi:MAG: hypothetical protein ACI9DK_003187, partial [Vicingaceae bacterium]